MAEIVEFECTPRVCICNRENFKIYGAIVDSTKYPNIKLNKYDNVTILGNVHDLGLDISYNVKAELQNGAYGAQYKILNIKRDRPQTLDDSRLFLSELLTPTQVDSILNAYPDIVDRVTNDRLDDIDLSKTPHIKEYIFNVIKNKIIDNFALVELIQEFQGLLDVSILKKIYKKYPSLKKLKNELKNDPYKCLCGLSGVAFIKADTILLTLERQSKQNIQKGLEPIIDFGYELRTSAQRCKACIMFCLSENEKNGHTKMDIVELRSTCNKLTPDCVNHFVDIVKNDKHIHIDNSKKFVALKSTYETELYIANRLKDGLKDNAIWNIDLSRYSNNDLTDEQFSAIEKLCRFNICILNGPGGSGKSYTTTTILQMLKDNNKTSILLAPTGKASLTLQGYANAPASTIHRGLGYMPPDDWTHNELMPFYQDVVVVDEFSMVDVFLMKRLIEAIDFKRTKLLIIGDNAQIPSVGAGNSLHDLMNSNLVPTTTLSKIFRYGIGGLMTVATNTRLSKKFLADTGKVEMFGEDKGYVFIPSEQEVIVDKVVNLYKKLLQEGRKAEDILVLSSYNKGLYGTININNHLQRVANAKSMFGKGLTIGDITFFKNDLVIQTSNNYKAKIYEPNKEAFEEDNVTFVPNGEIGRIEDINNKSIIIEFDGKLIEYDKKSAEQLKLAYSISTHKSQGSSIPIVIMVTPKAHTFMLNSNLMYVAQTRARIRCYHFGDVKTINTALKKKVNFNRNTFLGELLRSK